MAEVENFAHFATAQFLNSGKVDFGKHLHARIIRVAKFVGQALPLAFVAAAVRSGRISACSAPKAFGAGTTAIGGGYSIWQPKRLPYSCRDGWNCRSTAGADFARTRLGFFQRGAEGL